MLLPNVRQEDQSTLLDTDRVRILVRDQSVYLRIINYTHHPIFKEPTIDKAGQSQIFPQIQFEHIVSEVIIQTLALESNLYLVYHEVNELRLALSNYDQEFIKYF